MGGKGYGKGLGAEKVLSGGVWRYKGVASESFLSKGNGAGKGGGGMESANFFPLLLEKGGINRKGKKFPSTLPSKNWYHSSFRTISLMIESDAGAYFRLTSLPPPNSTTYLDHSYNFLHHLPTLPPAHIPVIRAIFLKFYQQTPI